MSLSGTKGKSEIQSKLLDLAIKSRIITPKIEHAGVGLGGGGGGGGHRQGVDIRKGGMIDISMVSSILAPQWPMLGKGV